jgi:hypothetical protein
MLKLVVCPALSKSGGAEVTGEKGLSQVVKKTLSSRIPAAMMRYP